MTMFIKVQMDSHFRPALNNLMDCTRIKFTLIHVSYKEGLDEYLIVVRPYFFTEVFTESIKNVDMTKIKKKSSREIQNWTVTLDCN